MRIFCPATLPHSPGRDPVSCRAVIALIGLADQDARPVVAPLFTCLGPPGPRGRVCRPHAAWSATEIGLVPRLGPEAPVWTPVVCPARRKPGARQPEQYALDPGIGQILPTRPPVRLSSGETARAAVPLVAPRTDSYSRVRYALTTASPRPFAPWRGHSGVPGG